MKFSREYITKNAFNVFLDRGYDSTSITVLQQELKMSRGALYRYFKNKEELFISVIDEHFFKPQQLFLKEIGKNKEQNLSELIQTTYQIQQRFVEAFSQIGVTRTFFLNYTALVIQAAKYYPDFVVHIKKTSASTRKIWRNAIEKSIETGEVRKDVNIDVLVRLFTAMTNSETSSEGKPVFTDRVMKGLQKRKETMTYLFDLIKA